MIIGTRVSKLYSKLKANQLYLQRNTKSQIFVVVKSGFYYVFASQQKYPDGDSIQLMINLHFYFNQLFVNTSRVL